MKFDEEALKKWKTRLEHAKPSKTMQASSFRATNMTFWPYLDPRWAAVAAVGSAVDPC